MTIKKDENEKENQKSKRCAVTPVAPVTPNFEITREEAETQLKSYSSWQLLNHIDTSNEHTKKLLSIIPQETISTILRVYRTIDTFLIEKDRKNPDEEETTYSEMPKKAKFPKKDLEKIQKILMKHVTKYKTEKGKVIVEKGWLEKNNVDEIKEFIRNRFWRPSYKSIQALYAEGRELRKKKEKMTRPPDEPLNIVIFLLAEHLKAKAGKPQWNLICDFLLEQRLINNDEDIYWEVIRDRYRKTKQDTLQKQYEFYRELYLYPEQKIKRDILPKQRQWLTSFRTHERDMTLPHWRDLLP